MPVLHALSSSLFVIHTYQLDTVSPARQLRLLFTSKNAVNPCYLLKLHMHRYVPMGFIRTHLIVLTISVIIAGQLNVNSWLSMLLHFISIECDFVSKQWMDLLH